jgi:putative oxidoreductase
MNCSHCSDGSGLKKASIGKLLLRIGIGVIFIYAGYFKLTHAAMVAPMFESLFGAGWLGTLVGLVELITGILVLVGFQTAVAGALQVIIMIVAIWTSHIGPDKGFTDVQFPMLVLLGSAAIALMSPGHYSVARCMCKHDGVAPVAPQV